MRKEEKMSIEKSAGGLARRWITAMAATASLLAIPLAAQTGTITGRVTDAATGAPVVNAQVIVVGTAIGAAVDDDGRFRVTGVPGTARQIRARSIGYQPSTATFTLVGGDLSDVTPAKFEGQRVVLNIFPSVDTGVCAASVRAFNERAASLDDATVLCVSADLPFALGRFCGAEDIQNVTTASSFRSSFGEDYGVTIADGPMAGLLARAVVVVDANGNVAYTELVPEIGQEPNYDAAIAALG